MYKTGNSLNEHWTQWSRKQCDWVTMVRWVIETGMHLTGHAVGHRQDKYVTHGTNKTADMWKHITKTRIMRIVCIRFATCAVTAKKSVTWIENDVQVGRYLPEPNHEDKANISCHYDRQISTPWSAYQTLASRSTSVHYKGEYPSARYI
jgi:hypothetical protein